MIRILLLTLLLFLFPGCSKNGGEESSDRTRSLSREEEPAAPLREQALVRDIRRVLSSGGTLDPALFPGDYAFHFDPLGSLVALTLFQPGEKPLRRAALRSTLEDSVARTVANLRSDSRFSRFAVADPDRCRILLEVVQGATRVRLADLALGELDPARRFEPGITGLRMRFRGDTYYYLPTEAVTRNHMSLNQVYNYLAKRMGLAGGTDKISIRAKRIREAEIDAAVIHSKAFVTYGEKLLPLYRGYPDPVVFSKERVRETAVAGVEWVYRNMEENGRFLYYYDPIKDTTEDHAHRGREVPYYNILRHSGGIITLLRQYELTGEKKYLEASRKAIGFLLEQSRIQPWHGETARYVFYNKKAKLGGTGIALAALTHYRRLTGDDRYDTPIEEMARHLLSRIDGTGEMIGYYIHPKFNKGRPIVAPDDKTKRELFSFYYPGEALLGLARVALEYPKNEPLKEQIRKEAKRAMDFLIYQRPKRYADLFLPLPADGWLMQAVEEWQEEPTMRDPAYRAFVFGDGEKMMAHTYVEENALYKDYKGMFFYDYGDHAYPDGARAEGLIAAYFLAKKTGDEVRAKAFLEHARLVALGLLHTYNSPESAYAHRYPEKSVGSFRFKITRQWVRVDSVQHTACFFARLYGEL